MRKGLLCVLAAVVLLLGILTGCGDRSSGGSDPDKPETSSTKPDKDRHKDDDPVDDDPADDDPVAVMNKRVSAVNNALNWERVGLEETVKDGLLFYRLTQLASPFDEVTTHDYNPDKPLDYYAWYEMYIAHTEGIVNEDTYVALLKNERYTENVVSSDVIETDDLYIYYSPYVQSTSANYRPWCYILVKDTDIVYLFTVGEEWYKANYYENGYYNFGNSSYVTAPSRDSVNLRYTDSDAEYIFTDEFWKAFAQTVKFVGNKDNDFSKGECMKDSVTTIGYRGKGVKIPYIEEWYAGQSMSWSAIYDGFKGFLEDSGVAVFYLDDGTVKNYPATKDSRDDVTIDLGDGQVWVYEDYHGSLELWREPENITGERLPETGYIYYNCDFLHFLAIDDFGQGEPTMFFNDGLYKYIGGGEVTLIHDFAEDNAGWDFVYIDADRTHLLFDIGHIYDEEMKVFDLKTFAVTDTVYISSDVISVESGRVFSSATVNGVSVDEETAWNTIYDWYSICDVYLGYNWSGDEQSLYSAWRAFEQRQPDMDDTDF